MLRHMKIKYNMKMLKALDKDELIRLILNEGTYNCGMDILKKMLEAMDTDELCKYILNDGKWKNDGQDRGYGGHYRCNEPSPYDGNEPGPGPYDGPYRLTIRTGQSSDPYSRIPCPAGMEVYYTTSTVLL